MNCGIPSNFRNRLGIRILVSNRRWRSRCPSLRLDLLRSFHYFRGSSFAFCLPPLFVLLPSSMTFYNSSIIGQTLDVGSLQYSFTIALSVGTFTNMASGIEPTKLNFLGSEIIKVNVFRIKVEVNINSSICGTLKWLRDRLTRIDQKRA